MMLTVLALWSSASLAQDDLKRVAVFPATWAVAVSAWQARQIDRREVRKVGCVGLEDKRMLCSWEQRISGSWRVKSAWTDLSDDRSPRILEAAKPED